jgi:CBS domain containing-hemolysin-like protein
MLLLSVYLFIALFFSFICSIAEAVLLSVNWAYIGTLEKAGHQAGGRLRTLKSDVNKPLMAILTLNTVAHTVGAAGVGAQAAVFGSEWLGVISAVLTLLILIFSEVIPKTLGATYWKALAPITSYCLKGMVWILYPFVVFSELITKKMIKEKENQGFQRNEFMVMAQMSADEGLIDQQESRILQNLLLLNDTKIMDAITPHSVVFSDAQSLSVDAFFQKNKKIRFSRIPVYEEDPDDIVGYVLRNDLLLAQARGNIDNLLSTYVREMPTFLDTMPLAQGLKKLVALHVPIALIVNEYGTPRGILTLEDILETLIGQEIVDEDDEHIDMQKLANKVFRHRSKKFDA